MYSEIHLLDNDIGHIFAADEGTVKQKGLSDQKFVIYSKENEKDEGKREKKDKKSKDKKPEIVVMKRNESTFVWICEC